MAPYLGDCKIGMQGCLKDKFVDVVVTSPPYNIGLLAPYLINMIHLSFNKAYSLLSDWVLKCNTFKTLNPSINNFLDYRIKLAMGRPHNLTYTYYVYSDSLVKSK